MYRGYTNTYKQEQYKIIVICSAKIRYIPVYHWLNIKFYWKKNIISRCLPLKFCQFSVLIHKGRNFWREEILADFADFGKIRQIKFPPKF